MKKSATTVTKRSKSTARRGAKTQTNAHAGSTAAVLSAVPRIADLKFASQKDRETAILADGVCQLVKEHVEANLDNYIAAYQHPSVELPMTGDRPIVRALARVRERLRLSHPVRIALMLRDDLKGARALSVLQDKTIHIFISASFLEDANEDELAYHLGVAIWKAFDSLSFIRQQVYGRGSLLPWMTHLELMAWERLSDYSAACYGLLACGNLDTAIVESWRQCMDQRAPHDSAGLIAIAENYAQQPRFAAVDICRFFSESPFYLFALPTVLQEFARSAPYKSLIGETGGTSCKEFQKRVEALDQRIHDCPCSIGVDFIHFHWRARFLSCAFLAAVAPDYSVDTLWEHFAKEQFDRTEFQGYLDLSDAAIEELGSRDRLEQLKTTDNGWAMPFIAYECLQDAYTQYHRIRAQHPEAEPACLERLQQLITWFGFSLDAVQVNVEIWEEALNEQAAGESGMRPSTESGHDA